ncbi:cytochrome P450 [Xylariomycetidae sp. FL2044]|nr:cytochrome P450 [Xylariomycetidae sp. FL2044]
MSIAIPLLVAFATVAWLLVGRLRRAAALHHLPRVRLEGDSSMSKYMTSYQSLMKQGYLQYSKNGQPFVIRNPSDESRPLVILPLKYLAEVKNAPQSKMSFPDFLEQSNLLKVVGGPEMTFEVTRMVRLNINRALNYLIHDLHEECLFAWEKVMPRCQEPTVVQPIPILNQLFARIAARVMVGPELCRDEEWIQLALSYTDVTIKAIRGVRAVYPPSLRFLAKYLDSNTRSVYRVRRRAAQKLRPFLEARAATVQSSAEYASESHYADAMKWLADVYRARGKSLSADQLAQDEFIVNVASITSSSAVALSVIYDLIDHPNILEEIREEIARVSREFGIWTRQSLGALLLLNSFMTESMRLHTLQQLTVQRTSVVPFTFKDGFHLPAGTFVSFPSQQLNLDDEVYTAAATFDARRFLRKREDVDMNKFHFASVSDDYITFGAGFHACPGRFLARDILKLMLIQLLTHYDVRLDGETQSRPPDIPYNFSIMPNMAAKLVLKEREVWRPTGS